MTFTISTRTRTVSIVSAFVTVNEMLIFEWAACKLEATRIR